MAVAIVAASGLSGMSSTAIPARSLIITALDAVAAVQLSTVDLRGPTTAVPVG
jgi:hypothetical protein